MACVRHRESRPSLVHGIACDLARLNSRHTVQTVLDRIRRKDPRSYQNLLRLVTKIRPFSRADRKAGKLGSWVPFVPKDNDASTWGYGEPGDTPGVVFLNEEAPPEQMVAIAAHEFGHVCVRREDLARRGRTLDDEWQHEMAADWYACWKWGVGRETARFRPQRNSSHHGHGPGTTFTIDRGDLRITYRVSRRLCAREIAREMVARDGTDRAAVAPSDWPRPGARSDASPESGPGCRRPCPRSTACCPAGDLVPDNPR